MMDVLPPEGACSGCPYRGSCHAPRRHAMAPLGEGRHTQCEFYQRFRTLDADAQRKTWGLPRIRITLAGLSRLARRMITGGE